MYNWVGIIGSIIQHNYHDPELDSNFVTEYNTYKTQQKFFSELI